MKKRESLYEKESKRERHKKKYTTDWASMQDKKHGRRKGACMRMEKHARESRKA